MKKNLLGISLLTITSLYFLLAAVIILIAILTDVPVIYGIVVSIIILILQFLISPWLTDLSMKWFYKAQFGYELPENIKSFVTEVCKQNNMNFPKIGYIDDGAPNAFTYGRTKNDARVVVTRGIFELLACPGSSPCLVGALLSELLEMLSPRPEVLQIPTKQT